MHATATPGAPSGTPMQAQTTPTRGATAPTQGESTPIQGKSTPTQGEPTPVVIGIDVGGTKMAAAAVAPLPEPHLLSDPRTIPTPAQEGPDAMVAAMAGLAAQVMSGAQPFQEGTWRLVGVGVGTAGVVDVSTRTIIDSTDAIRDWTGTALGDDLAAQLARLGVDCPVERIHVQNDVDAYAMGESQVGAGREYSTMLMAAVGTGVGGALVLNGQVWSGAHHAAGEMGHVPVPGAADDMCTCGTSGHLEAITAGPAIARRYRRLSGDDTVSGAKEIETRALAGDPVAQQVYRESAVALGQALAGLSTVIDPDCVVVSGGLARAGECWWEPLREAFRAELIPALKELPLIPGRVGTNAPILGSAASTWRLPEVQAYAR